MPFIVLLLSREDRSFWAQNGSGQRGGGGGGVGGRRDETLEWVKELGFGVFLTNCIRSSEFLSTLGYM